MDTLHVVFSTLVFAILLQIQIINAESKGLWCKIDPDCDDNPDTYLNTVSTYTFIFISGC